MNDCCGKKYGENNSLIIMRKEGKNVIKDKRNGRLQFSFSFLVEGYWV